MTRSLTDRIMDKLWTLASQGLEATDPPPGPSEMQTEASSVSATTDWPLACAALANGAWSSRNFRRRHAVRRIVETLAPSDARQFARWLRQHRPALLDDDRVRRVGDWGDPIKAPGWLLGCRHAWSPSSLRYLAHAVWLGDSGHISENGHIVEVGVGFGGLAAMLAVVSGAITRMADLPEVERAATLQMSELGLGGHVATRPRLPDDFTFVSNYAFTELTGAQQDRYIEEFARHAPRGVIISNAGVFARSIGGRNDDELVARLKASGIDARIIPDAPVLGPSDMICGNRLICWNGKTLVRE